MNYRFDIATEEDDEQLRNLLKNTPMPGNMSVAFTREPCYFYGSQVEGNTTNVITAKIQNRLIGMGSHSLFRGYLNGNEFDLGYLSQLRIDSQYRGNLKMLLGGYNLLKQIHVSSSAPFSMTTIIEDNERAKKLLTSNKFGLPSYEYSARFETLAIPFRTRIKNKVFPFQIERGSKAISTDIVECLQQNGRQKQFYPVYSQETLESESRSSNLTWEDFFVAKLDNRIVGVVACWDQSSFKQTVVTSYSRKMKLIRPFYNLVSSFISYPSLPIEGKPFSYFYISHVAVDNNDPEIFEALLQAVYNQYFTSGYDYCMVGFCDQDPLLYAAKKLKHIVYPSLLYLVHWGDGADTIRNLDNRIPYLEMARI